MMPVSLEKRNTAGPWAVPFCTTNPPPLLLKTTPVGTPPRMATANAGIVPLPALNRLDESVPLLAIHHGDVQLAAGPNALTTRPSCWSAGIIVVSPETRLCGLSNEGAASSG